MSYDDCEPDLIERFTEGDCYIFAIEIAKITKWQIYAFDDGGSKWGNIHAFVLDPKGFVIDIEGRHKMTDFCDKWGCEQIMPVKDRWLRLWWQSEEPLDSVYDENGCLRPRREIRYRRCPAYGWSSWPIARREARKLLDRLGYLN